MDHGRSKRWLGDYVPGRRKQRPTPSLPLPATPPPSGAEVIEPPPLQCPFCSSVRTVVTKTLATIPVIRYRLCRGCGQTFKTRQGE